MHHFAKVIGIALFLSLSLCSVAAFVSINNFRQRGHLLLFKRPPSLPRNYNSRTLVKSSLAGQNNITLPDLRKEEVAALPCQNGSIKRQQGEAFASDIACLSQEIEQIRADVKLLKDRVSELDLRSTRLEEIRKERESQRVTMLGNKRKERKQPRRKKQRVERLENPR